MTNDHRSKVLDPILDYPEFAATIGMLTSQATYLEAQLGELFTYMVGTDSRRGHVLYWSYPTYNQRQRVMHQLLEHSYQPLKTEITAILRRSKNFIKFRNEAVHDLWTHREDGSSPVHRITVNIVRDSEPEQVTVKLREMRDRVETAIKLNADLTNLINILS